jgi:transglutaminase-like putative cysteine protease
LPTRLCDSEDPWLRERAGEIVADAGSPAERALRIFYYVRDNVRFSLAYSHSTASQTLKRGYGECGNKTNAQVALLRAVGVAARFRWVAARSDVLNHLIADFVFKRMPPVASHFWCECYLDGEWVACEALLDRTLYEGMLESGLITTEQIPSIEWDGKTDRIILTPWITEHHGPLSSYDDALSALKWSKEGMPPLWIERIIAPFFYRLNPRRSDGIRRLAGGGQCGEVPCLRNDSNGEGNSTTGK